MNDAMFVYSNGIAMSLSWACLGAGQRLHFGVLVAERDNPCAEKNLVRSSKLRMRSFVHLGIMLLCQ